MPFTETLELLEWGRLCQHLAVFAHTKLGVSACVQLEIPDSQTIAETLLHQTQEALLLDLPFQGIQDIREAVTVAGKGGTLSSLELLAIAQTLFAVRNLRRSIESADFCPYLQELVQEVRTYPELEQAIHYCIDDSGMVLNRASPHLEKIRQGLVSTRETILQKLHHIMQTQSAILQETTITQRQEVFVLAIKANYKDRLPGIVRDSSNSGLTLYIEPQSIVNLHNKLSDWRQQELVEITKILQNLSLKVSAVVPDLEKLIRAVTAVDLANARAQYSRWLGANPPEFSDKDIDLRELRHPLLVWQAERQNGQSVVPIQIGMTSAIRSVIITGPNTGGKTATLKTFGLVSLMAKAGLFIPARSPVKLPYFDGIFADIGDEQSLEQNLSTFSGHIQRIQRILTQITPHSLVLLDEVGAGTDPSEGVAIARALLLHLAENARLTITTTHYGELKLLKYENSLFENASVEFDEVHLTPTYRLLWGIPGRSQAIAIARRLGLEEQILVSAQQQLGHGKIEVEKIIQELVKEHQQLTAANQRNQQLWQDLQKLHTELLSHWQKWQDHGREWRDVQEREVKRHINYARKEIGKMVRKLQKGTGAPADILEAEQSLTATAEKHLPPVLPPVPATYVPRIGDRVKLLKLDQVGQVLSVPNQGGEVSIKLGGLRLSVNLADISKV